MYLFVCIIIYILHTDPCNSRICQNDGVCKAVMNGDTVSSQCECPAGFEGEDCQTGSIIIHRIQYIISKFHYYDHIEFI